MIFQLKLVAFKYCSNQIKEVLILYIYIYIISFLLTSKSELNFLKGTFQLPQDMCG